jgi:hypothetical protein
VTTIVSVLVTVSVPEPVLMPEAVAVAPTSPLNVNSFFSSVVEFDPVVPDPDPVSASFDEAEIPTPAATAIAREVNRPVFVMNDPSPPDSIAELVAVAVEETSAFF